MTDEKMADESRKGMIATVKGKAKEVAGAVTRNDSLTAEGRLEQEEARKRKEANTIQAVADADAEQATDEARTAHREGIEERMAVSKKTATVENSIRYDEAAQKRTAEKAASQDAARAKTQAELDAQNDVLRAKAQEQQEMRAAGGKIVDASVEHRRSAQAAGEARAEADRIREQADELTDEADLP